MSTKVAQDKVPVSGDSSNGDSDAKREDSGNSTTHVGTNTRQSPLRNEVNDTTGYVDPFEEHAATRRSDSVKGRARPLSTVDDSAVSYGARPPSFIEVPVSLRPTYKEPIANNEAVTKGKQRRDRRRKSLECGQILNDNVLSQAQKPATKAVSEDNLLAALGSTSTDTMNHKSTHDKQHEKGHLLEDQVLPFPDRTMDVETPAVSPLSPVHGSANPMQDSDRNPTYVHTYSGLVSIGASLMPRDEVEARLNAIEQKQRNLYCKMEKIEHTQNAFFNCTMFEWCITNIKHSIKVAKDKKISAGSVANYPPFYTKDIWGGYRMCVRVYFNGDGKGKGAFLSVFLVIMKGEYDRTVEIVWPFNRRVTFNLVNPVRGGENIVASISSGAKTRAKDPAFQRPKTEVNIPIGFPQFVSHKKLYSGGFVQNDSIVLRVVVDTECIEPLPQLPEHCSEK